VFEGVYVALVTPFRRGELDLDGLARVVDRCLAAGVDGLVACGTTGESPVLSDPERADVIRACVARARGRAKVLAGTGSNDTRKAIAWSRAAEDLGADGLLVVTPYYNKPSQEGLYRHYQAVHDATGLPIMLYNIPGRTGVAIAPETAARIASLPRVLAVKDATGDVDGVTRLRGLCRLAVMSGEDALTLPLIAVGAVGVVSAAANVAPAEFVALVRAARAGRMAEALALHDRLHPLIKALFIETNPVPVKAALAQMGLIADEVRPPLTPLRPEHLAALRAAMERFGGLTPPDAGPGKDGRASPERGPGFDES
jgi:4-hydroxy-tetrahydrodipicolinate synthase